jgi:N-terminal acetyltransferase B complex non-catalytic subunit
MQFDSRISSASDLVQKLQRDAENSNLRGPYLAELEIEKRKFLFGKKNEDKLLESLLQYFLKFGHLACYASDVEAYLQVLSPNKKAGFVEMLVKNSDSSASATKVLGQTTTILKVQELTGNIFGLPTDEIEASAVKLAKLYCQNLSLSKDLDPQESMFGEELLSLISNMLVQLFWRTRDFGYLAEAIMVLELGLTIRGSVHHIFASCFVLNAKGFNMALIGLNLIITFVSTDMYGSTRSCCCTYIHMLVLFHLHLNGIKLLM